MVCKYAPPLKFGTFDEIRFTQGCFRKFCPRRLLVCQRTKHILVEPPLKSFFFFVKSSPSARRAEHRFAAAHGHGPRRPPLEEEQSPSCVRDCCAISMHCWRLAFAASSPWPGRLGTNGPRRTPGDLRTNFPVILAVSDQPHVRSPQLRARKRFRTSHGITLSFASSTGCSRY
jgi:hypothetical protein